jgi:hypothetical protein
MPLLQQMLPDCQPGRARGAARDGGAMYSNGKLMRGNFEQSRRYCGQTSWHIAIFRRKMVQMKRSAAIGGICRVPRR